MYLQAGGQEPDTLAGEIGGNHGKIYIAGKITGDANYKEKFRRAEELLTSQGHIVLNPARLPEGMRPGDYMRICFAMLDVADIAAFLPDYCDSPGVRLEYDWYRYTGKPKDLLLI